MYLLSIFLHSAATSCTPVQRGRRLPPGDGPPMPASGEGQPGATACTHKGAGPLAEMKPWGGKNNIILTTFLSHPPPSHSLPSSPPSPPRKKILYISSCLSPFLPSSCPSPSPYCPSPPPPLSPLPPPPSLLVPHP